MVWTNEKPSSGITKVLIHYHGDYYLGTWVPSIQQWYLSGEGVIAKDEILDIYWCELPAVPKATQQLSGKNMALWAAHTEMAGLSSTEAERALNILTQASSGVLRGDELRSVIEGLPTLASTIATHMGITVGRLSRLGCVTTDVISAAIKAKQRSLINVGVLSKIKAKR